MTKPNKTEIAILLDRSGSMSSIKSDMVNGFKYFIEEQKKIDGECFVSLYQFDSVKPFEIVYECEELYNVDRLVLNPRGGTPLIDAACKTIDRIGNRLKETQEEDRPERVIVVIITDGLENMSEEFTTKDLAKKIRTQKTEFNWTFVYLGANQDAIVEGKRYGFSGKTDKVTYTPNAKGVKKLWETTGKAIGRSRKASFDNYTHISENGIYTQEEVDSFKE